MSEHAYWVKLYVGAETKFSKCTSDNKSLTGLLVSLDRAD